MLLTLFGRDQCTIINDGEHKIKDLAKLRPRPLESIVILDDNPISSKLQPQCSLPIKKWTHDQHDIELSHVTRQLELLLRMTTCALSFAAGILRLNSRALITHFYLLSFVCVCHLLV
jgi:hypothetical protein